MDFEWEDPLALDDPVNWDDEMEDQFFENMWNWAGGMGWTRALWDQHVLWIWSRRDLRMKRLEAIVPQHLGHSQFDHLGNEADWYSGSSVSEMDWQPDPMDLDEPEVTRPPPELQPAKLLKEVQQPQKPPVKKRPLLPEVEMGKEKEKERERPVTAFSIQW